MLVIATTGLVYELAMAAVASFVLGDSVTQFSLVIGVYLSALGMGAYLSRFIVRGLLAAFVDVELAAALVGGLSAPALFAAFAWSGSFQFLLLGTVLVVGVLVGLELPLLLRILEQRLELKELVARALSVDYAGALLGSLGFSLWLVPHLGLVHTTLATGLANAAVALASTFLLPTATPRDRRALAGARVRAVLVIAVLGLGLGLGRQIADLAEAHVYGGSLVHAEQSPYQRIVVARRGAAVQLYLSGNLQFSSDDEHRYHEALVHPAFGTARSRARVLVGGGGDGLALREIWRWPDVGAVTLVDLDARVTTLARTLPELVSLSRGSLDDPRLRLVNADAFKWLQASTDVFDVIVLDFPDPNQYSLGKLYSLAFYRSVREHLAPGGALVVQATSPLFARRSYWCVVSTLEAAGLHVRPYHAYVPSFGEWGYALAAREPFAVPSALPPAPLRWLDAATLRAAFELPADLARVAAPINRLDDQALVSTYQDEWSRWNL